MEKYRLIYRDILNQLINEQYHPGDLLPSDHRYMIKYQVSRETVRKALKLLATDGYIKRLQGKGSIVTDRHHFQFPLTQIESYSEIVKKEDLNFQNIVLGVDDVIVPEIFNPQPPDLAATRVSRVRVINGESLIIDQDYVLKSQVNQIPRFWAQKSLFGYLEDVCKFKIDYAVKTLTVETANEFDQKYLRVSKSMPMVIIRSRTHLVDNSVISYTESHYRADRYSSVVFARRHP